MKTTIVLAALVALTFTTGFTCSKNTPAPETQEQAAPAPTEAAPQDAMGAPADAAAPTEAAPADAAAPVEGAAPTEAAPAGTGN